MAEITYIVEYDEIVHRTCRVTIDDLTDITFNSTAEAVEDAVESGETDEDYETDSGVRVISWRPV